MFFNFANSFDLWIINVRKVNGNVAAEMALSASISKKGHCMGLEGVEYSCMNIIIFCWLECLVLATIFMHLQRGGTEPS